MKTASRISLFFLTALVLVLATCKIKDSDDDIFTVDDSDSLGYGYLAWADSNRYNAVFGQGQSVFVIVNHPGTVIKDLDYISGDTTITVTRRCLDADSCKILSFGAYPGRTRKNHELPAGENRLEGTARQVNASVRFPSSSGFLNGSSAGRAPIDVVDNRVNIFGGYSFSVDEPTAFGPPSLAALLLESINNPPPAPAQAQIDALECGEIIGCYMISREIHVSINKQWNWTSGSNSYQQVANYSFGFSHYWYYECPDGPLIRAIFVSVRITIQTWWNGVLDTTTRVEDYYRYQY